MEQLISYLLFSGKVHWGYEQTGITPVYVLNFGSTVSLLLADKLILKKTF